MKRNPSLSLIVAVVIPAIGIVGAPAKSRLHEVLPKFQNKMIHVKGGSFLMSERMGEGREDELPHPVTVSDFLISQYEVTVGEFRQFARETGYVTQAERENSALVYHFASEADRGWRDVQGASWKAPGFDQTDLHPVVCVSWNDAKAYCEWFSNKAGKPCRLPTEAEWEFVARGRGKSLKYLWGEGDPNGKQCNFADKSTPYPWAEKAVDDGHWKTAPVGSFPPNELGLYDLAGNVWEWCEDWYASYPKEPQLDPRGPDSGESRVMRGGSWINRAGDLRTVARNYDTPSKRYENLGFRVATPVRSSP